MHLLAKEIISEEKRMPLFVNNSIEFVAVETIEQEKSLGDIKPDLYAEVNGKPVAVEIFVSHAVDNVKFLKIQKHKLTTFEINLSEMLFETKEDVKKAVYDLKNINLIYDEYATERAIENKKNFIDANGVVKNIVNGCIQQCPMNLKLNGRQAMFSNVQITICNKCPFGYILQGEDKIHCIGHKNIELSKVLLLARLRHNNITITLNDWWLINVSESKIVPLSELSEYFTCISGIKFTEIKRKNIR